MAACSPKPAARQWITARNPLKFAFHEQQSKVKVCVSLSKQSAEAGLVLGHALRGEVVPNPLGGRQVLPLAVGTRGHIPAEAESVLFVVWV